MRTWLLSGSREVRLLLGLAVAASALLATGGAQATGGSSATVKAIAPVVISTKTLPKLGTVLVNGQGRTLYMFVPDKQKKVTCLRSCATAWPPVKLPAGAKTRTEGLAKSSLLGSDPNPAGGRVVTYNKWPLYTWLGDTAPGKATGQAINANGGLWYVLSPAGKVITTKPSSPSATTTTPAAPPTTTTTAAAPPTTTSASSTTTAAAPPPPPTTTTTLGPGGTDVIDGCPTGKTIPTSGNSDGDDDETGGQSDGDGCI